MSQNFLFQWEPIPLFSAAEKQVNFNHSKHYLLIRLLIVTRKRQIVWKHGPSSLKSIQYPQNLPKSSKHQGSILKNILGFEGDQLLAGAFHVIMDKIEGDIIQTARRQNWKLTFIHQGHFFRNIHTINTSFTPK